MLLGNRYYDCTIGRFISQDPAQDESNWYAYCGNNPLVAVDSSGLEAQSLNGSSTANNPPDDKSLVLTLGVNGSIAVFIGACEGASMSLDLLTGEVSWTKSETVTIGVLPGKADVDLGNAGVYAALSNTKPTEGESTGVSYGAHAAAFSGSVAAKDGHVSIAGGYGWGSPNVGINKQITKSDTVKGSTVLENLVAPIRNAVNEWVHEGFQKIYGIP